MPGKNAKQAKNRPNQLNASRRKDNNGNNDEDDSTPSINSTVGASDLNSIRSRSPLKTHRASTDAKPQNPILNSTMRPTPTNMTSSQAGSPQKSISPVIEAKGSQLTLTKTAPGQAGNAVATAETEGEVELVVINDESFPDEMDITENRNGKRKRETDLSLEQVPSQPPQAVYQEQTFPTMYSAEEWKKVHYKSNHSFKIPKSTGNPEDLRTKIPKKVDLRQQLNQQQPPQQHQHQQQHQHKPTYASATGRSHPSAPPSQSPWGPLELRVYCTNFRQAPMDQNTWSSLQLNIMELVQNEAESEEADEDDLKIIEVKKMWWHAKLECGIIETYSREALEWYKNIINKMGNRLRAWTWMEKPEPRLKVWIKPQFAHLEADKYIQLCLKFHPQIRNQPWKLESTTTDADNKRTAYIRTSQEILLYLQNEGSNLDKFTIKGF